jgi:hypothetical protein
MGPNFFFGKIRLNLYILHLKAYLLDLEDINKEEFIRFDKSIFGTWFVEDLQRRGKDADEIRDIKLAAEKIHSYAGNLIRNKETSRELAIKEFNKIENVSNELNKILQDLHDKSHKK